MKKGKIKNPVAGSELQLKRVAVGVCGPLNGAFYCEVCDPAYLGTPLWTVIGCGKDGKDSFAAFLVAVTKAGLPQRQDDFTLDGSYSPKTPRNTYLSIETAAQVKHKEAVDKVTVIAKEIVRDTVGLAEKYVTLVQHIREHQLKGEEVRPGLLEAGFNKVRVSEILRIANAPGEVFDRYAAREIGLKSALQLTRGSADGTAPNVIREIAQASGETAEQVEEELIGDGAALAGAKPVLDDADKVAQTKNAMILAGKRVLLLAAKLVKLGENARSVSQVWNMGDGYTLTLSKDKPAGTGFKKGAPAAAK